jgi:hypothetical protein
MIRTFLLGVAGVAIIALTALSLIGPTTAQEPPRAPNRCDLMVSDLGAVRVDPANLEWFLHSIGCNQDAGGVYIPDTSNGCARTAFLLYISGFNIEEVRSIVTGNGECMQHEDGVFTLAQPVSVEVENPSTPTP